MIYSLNPLSARQIRATNEVAMKKNGRLSVALHLLIHLAERTAAVTCEDLAACVHTNPVVVRRT